MNRIKKQMLKFLITGKPYYPLKPGMIKRPNLSLRFKIFMTEEEACENEARIHRVDRCH